MAVIEGSYLKRSVVIPVTLASIDPEDLYEEIFTYLKSEPVPYVRGECVGKVLIDYLSERVR